MDISKFYIWIERIVTYVPRQSNKRQRSWVDFDPFAGSSEPMYIPPFILSPVYLDRVDSFPATPLLNSHATPTPPATVPRVTLTINNCSVTWKNNCSETVARIATTPEQPSEYQRFIDHLEPPWAALSDMDSHSFDAEWDADAYSYQS